MNRPFGQIKYAKRYILSGLRILVWEKFLISYLEKSPLFVLPGILMRRPSSIILITILFMLVPLSPAHAASGKNASVEKKERLVLMPIKVEAVDRSMLAAMETALVEGMQDRYKIFAGEKVANEVRRIFDRESRAAKKECDETRCMLDIAMAFQADLIAVTSITKRSDGYFLALSIRNISDDTVVLSRSLPCEGCSEYQVVGMLKTLAGGGSAALGGAPVAPPPSKGKPAPSASPAVPSGDFSLEELDGQAKAEEERKAAEKAKWDKYLSEMKKAFGQVEGYEKRDISRQLKITAWEKFLKTYKDDDPYSTEDEEMREKAKGRIETAKAGGEIENMVSVKLKLSDEVKAKWKDAAVKIVDKVSKDTVVVYLKIGFIHKVVGDFDLKLVAVVPDYAKSDGSVVSSSNEAKNPAVLLTLYRNDKAVTKGWVFNKFPEFNTFISDRFDVVLESLQKSQNTHPLKDISYTEDKNRERHGGEIDRIKTGVGDVEGMVFVKGGCYQMGDNFGDGDNNEKPVHNVCVGDFYMGKYEVTQRQWTDVMGSNPSHFKNCDDCPVESISWNDVQDFINRLKQKTGDDRYRLPTEAEWEYAARSGGKKEKFAGTSSESELGEYAWYDGNSGGKTHPVGQKKPNGLGLYDMSGNVLEWVSDWYDGVYNGNSPKNNPVGPSSDSNRVYRGGSWLQSAWFVRSASRGNISPVIRFDGNLGFRLVRTR